MTSGVGIDIIEIDRVAKAMKRKNFLKRLFSANEIAALGPKIHKAACVAARFAAKEAACKALGTGFSGISPRELEVFNDRHGKPYMLIRGQAVKVSLSHCKQYAVAAVIIDDVEPLFTVP